MNTTTFDRSRGNWYKGNLHCHSTRSDGSLEPEVVARMYREKGYSFLAFSEHEIYTHRTDLETPGFLIIPAIERSVKLKDADQTDSRCHLQGIWSGRGCVSISGTTVPVPLWTGPETVQAVIDELERDGYFVTFNHPAWSRNDFRDLEQANGYTAVEVYNHSCEEESHTGHTELFWDHMLRHGRKLWGIATDDNHNEKLHGKEIRDWDSFGGWVMVNADELSYRAVGEALQSGKFYSSTGPRIYEYGVRDATDSGGSFREVHIECSPAERIFFPAHPGRGSSRRNPDGGTLESATYRLTGREAYVRAVVVDEVGKMAWTNPIFFDGR